MGTHRKNSGTQLIAPEICTSLSCPSYPCDYCRRCSHAWWYGEGRDRHGKLWRWHFNPRFGPKFLRKDRKPLKRPPTEEGHMVWEPFNRWVKTQGF